MSEPRTTGGFFRPWHVPETSARVASGIVDDDARRDKREDDDDEGSYVSSATSMTSVTSSIAGETSEKCDSTVSTSLNVVRRRARRRRRGSDVFSDDDDDDDDDDPATSSTPSLEGEDVVGSTVRDARNKSSRVFRSPIEGSFDDSTTKAPTAVLARDPDVNPLKYLSTFEFRRPETFARINDGTYTTTSSDAAGPSSVPMMIPDQLYYAFTDLHSGMHPGIHPGIHSAIQPGFPSDFYNRSVEEAVQMVNRQDVVAKQMKKMRPKKFRCQYCDVAFSNNGQLKGHVRIHTGERPFKCDVESCGKSFTRNEELTRHKRIHTGVRPHSCLVCGKRFGRKDHLKKHARTHEVRVSAAALGVFALGHPFQQATGLPPYIYQI